MDTNPLFFKDEYTLEDVFEMYKKMQITLHYMHLETPLYAKHEALGALYGAIAGLSDRFAETALGYTNRSIKSPVSLQIDILSSDKADTYLAMYSNKFDKLCQKCNVASVENILAETLEQIQKTIYLLKLN